MTKLVWIMHQFMCAILFNKSEGVQFPAMPLWHSLAAHNQRGENARFPLPFPFPSKLHIICMTNLEEIQSIDSLEYLGHLIDLNNGGGR